MNRKNRILGLPIGSARVVCMFALMAGGLLQVGCGQKGPLYHPSGNASAPVITPYPVESAPLPEESVLPR